MFRYLWPALAGGALLGVALPATAVAPQRTFVASYGNDASACSLTAPCRGFQAAINAVAAGGEVVALDSGGYGTMAIHKSVSVIVPPGIHAGLSPITGIPLPGFPGQSTVVLIDIGNADVVTLRGLNITHQGSVTGGIDWISANAGVVHVENTVVNGFANEGLLMGTLGGGSLYVKDSQFRNNGYGIYVRRQNASTGMSRVNVDNVRIDHANAGFVHEGFVETNLRNVAISGSGTGIYALASNSVSGLYVDHCTIGDSDTGIHLDGTSATGEVAFWITNSTVLSNGQSMVRTGPNSYVYSYGNNGARGLSVDLYVTPN